MGSENAQREKIRTAIEAYARAHQVQVNEAYGRDDSRFETPTISIMWGRRYARIVFAHAGQRTARAFVDMTTGDVLKPDGWKGPARHARGNVLDVHAGLGSTTAYGVAYLY
jgi:hypothetical protein